MKGIKYGYCLLVTSAVLGIASCAEYASKQSALGPVRGNNPISGDLTNATITFGDPHLVYVILAAGILSVVGVVYLAWRLAQHHSTVTAKSPK